jgi:hypothetical protein
MAVIMYKQDYLPGFAPCKAQDENRIQKLVISQSALLQILTFFGDGTRRYQMLGMPPDAKIVSMFVEEGYPPQIILYISSCSFEPLNEASPVPSMLPTVTVTTDFYPVPNTEYYYKTVRPVDATENKGDKECTNT